MIKNSFVEQNPLLFWLFVALIVFFIWWLIAILCVYREEQYLKMEMERSFDRGEYRYWEKQLIKLHLRCIPIIGMFIRR